MLDYDLNGTQENTLYLKFEIQNIPKAYDSKYLCYGLMYIVSLTSRLNVLV
jgi:hypothetical protein